MACQNFVYCDDSNPSSADLVQDSDFLRLPEEMFLHICSFLDVTDIVVSLSRVCRQFNTILQSDNIWKCWIASRWGGHYPIVDTGEQIDWKQACFSIEQDCKAWTNKSLVKYVTDVVEGHLSDVDCCLFLHDGKRCVTGGRDRNLIYWETTSSKRPENVVKIAGAHDGWIWRLRQKGHTLYSASWDNTIKLWDTVENISVATETFRCDSAVLCVNVDDSGVVYGGCFKKIYVFDPRAQPTPIFVLEATKQPVLTLDLLGEDLISGNESKSIHVWDLTARKLKQRIKMPSTYPASSQVVGRLLYVGDREGKVRVYVKEDGSLVESAVIDTGHGKAVTIKVFPGSIVAASESKVTVSLPLRPLHPVSEFAIQATSASGMDCCNGRLAVGTSTAVEFWLPGDSVPDMDVDVA